MQYHYVGLDKLPVCGTGIQQHAQSNPNDTNTNFNNLHESLDNATIEEGDEHRRQISGAPLASMIFVENPETSKEIIFVAPAFQLRKEKPLKIMTDSNFEPMSNLISSHLVMAHTAVNGLRSYI